MTDNLKFGKCRQSVVGIYEGGKRVVINDRNSSAIVKLAVCNNDNRKERLKGIEIWGSRINDDGSATFDSDSNEVELPNCKEWGSAVICDEGWAATGLNVYVNSLDDITALSLICRRIEQR